MERVGKALPGQRRPLDVLFDARLTTMDVVARGLQVPELTAAEDASERVLDEGCDARLEREANKEVVDERLVVPG